MGYLEADLKTELVKVLRSAGCVAHKFPDNARGVIKPYDLVAGIRGRLCAIETKLTKVGSERHLARRDPGMVVLHLKEVRRNQAIALSDARDKGCWAFVGAAIYEQMTGDRECFMVPWSIFRQRETWTLGELQKLGWPHLVWTRGRGWDVSPLVEWTNVRHFEVAHAWTIATEIGT